MWELVGYLENSKERTLYLHFGQDNTVHNIQARTLDITFPFLFFLEFDLFLWLCLVSVAVDGSLVAGRGATR